MSSLPASPALGIAIAVAAYWAATRLRDSLPSPVVNPLAVSAALIILLIELTPLTLADFKPGGDVVAMFIVPATTVLALKIHRQWQRFRENLLPILAGSLAGSFVSIASIILLGRLLLPDQALTASLMPKSVTTAIALELSEASGGIGSVTVSAVVLTGIISAIASPLLVRLFRLRDAAAVGVAIGTSGHAMGTSKAIEMGEVEGAMSGIALVVAGIATSVMYLAT